VVRLLAPFGLVVLAFGLRVLSWPSVLVGDRVHLAEPDAWYHLRRIVYAVRNAPATLGFDPFLNFPHGAEAIWPPLFDTAIATLLRPLVGAGAGFTAVDQTRIEQIVIWLPPLLGAATVWALFTWMRDHFGFGQAVVSAAVLAVLSGSVVYARVGVVDHHVAVALIATLMLGAGSGLLKALQVGARTVAWAIWLGVLQALMLAIWPGGLLHVVLVDLGLVGFALTRPRREDALRVAAALAVVYLVGFTGTLLSGPPDPSLPGGVFSPLVQSHFQSLFFGIALLVLIVCMASWSSTALGGNRLARSGLLLGVGGVCVLLVLLWLPGLADGLGEAGRWLGRAERFQGSVVESRPILFSSGEFDTRLAEIRLSRFVFFVPLVWLWLVAREIRGERRPELFLLAVFALGLGLATLVQARFVNAFAVPVAALLGLAVVAVWRAFIDAGAGRLRRSVVATSLVLATGWMFSPVLWSYAPDLRSQLDRFRGDPIRLEPGRRYWLALEETARWIRAATPSAGDAYEAGAPAFGLLGHWQYGHLLLYVAERPVVVGNFGDDLGGDNYALSFRYFRAAEQEAAELLSDLHVRYVVIRPLDVGGGDLGEGSMINRLAAPDPNGLAHHRLVYERRVLPNEQPRSHFRVFEHVAGAAVEGRAPPDRLVQATLAYASPTGRKGQLRQSTRSDSAGRYRLRLPYATRGGPSGVVVHSAWQIALEGGQPQPMAVAEAAVQAGTDLVGPDLR
jgi:asparagine N-glycosylation enzyme membrane subunit Stt3